MKQYKRRRLKEPSDSARAQALALGETRYTGKICNRHPHLNGERITTSRVCVDCEKAWRRHRAAKQRRLEKYARVIRS
jgi:hypothetical protein